jgi:O-antigen ligase
MGLSAVAAAPAESGMSPTPAAVSRRRNFVRRSEGGPAAAASAGPPATRPTTNVARRKPDALLTVIALLIASYIWRLQDMIVVLGKIKFPTLLALVVLWLYLMDTKTVRRFRYVQSPTLKLLFVWTAIIAFGIPTSVLPGATFDFLTKDFLPDVLMVTVVGAGIRSLRDLEWLLAVDVIGAMAYNIYTVLFFSVDDSNGRLGGLLYYDGNDLAQIIVCTLPVTFYFLRDGSPRWQRRLALCSLPVLLLNFIRAGSRGGFLGFAAIVVAALLAFRPIKPRKRLAAILLLLGAISVIGGDAFWAKMKTILSPDDDYNMKSETGRWQVWKNGMSLIRQRPFLGVGARQFAQANASMSDLARQRIAVDDGRIPWQPAHNSYVSVAAETGVGGFAVFASLLIGSLLGTIRLMLRARRLAGGADLAALASSLALVFVGYMVSAFFLTAEYQAVLYLNFGFLIGMRKLFNSETRSAAGPPAIAPSLRARPEHSRIRRPGHAAAALAATTAGGPAFDVRRPSTGGGR